MSRFSPQWLALRGPHDERARNVEVVDAAVDYFRGRLSIGVVDLACGAGAALRNLASRLPATQRWRFVDNDPALLALAASAGASAGCAITTVALDLNQSLDAALEGPIDLVVASALLDLVSRDWIERLADRLAARTLPLYAALSYDGRIEIGPSDSLDDAVVAGVNAHQRRDKGFGPALGPTAAGFTISSLLARGYAVVAGDADWLLGPDDRGIQNEVVAGWAAAAREAGALSPAEIERWLSRRRRRIAAGRSSLRVGHVDVFASPSGAR